MVAGLLLLPFATPGDTSQGYGHTYVRRRDRYVDRARSLVLMSWENDTRLHVAFDHREPSSLSRVFFGSTLLRCDHNPKLDVTKLKQHRTPKVVQAKNCNQTN